jgi:hypothetical protein
MENLIRVNDTMRLKKLPNDRMYHLRPDPLLLGRWGGEMNYFVRLQQSENDARVYCGDVRILRGGNRIEHKLALSEVRFVPVIDDAGKETEMVTDVTLFFYGAHPGQDPEPDDGCTFHDIHGGLAHVHQTN